MEATRKIRVSKSKKKGDKETQVISAADEARKREAVKEALRQKLELERKALQVVERLLEDSVTEEFLMDCAWHITPANYKDTVEERSIAKLCGYPRCPNKLTNVPTQQFKISTKTNRVYDITERKCFCSNFCYKASKCFELQISKTPLWLRKDERPPEVKLMKEGDGGSSGQEIKLVDKPVTEADIENPVPDISESNKDSTPFSQSDNSDLEEDFVSSVVSRQCKNTRVHWGKLPKREGVSEDGLSAEPEPTQTLDGENNDGENNDESGISKTPQPQKDPSACLSIPNNTTSTGSDLEGTLELLNQCSLKDAASQQETNLSSGLNITQVGMSKRGAAGLKGLLKDHNKAKTTPTISLCLLEHLRQTFMEWRTEETMKFLYGSDYACGTESSAQEVEELDEDDLDEAEVEVSLRQNSGSSSRPSAPAPDFEMLRKETELLELRVREFYKGVYVLPEEIKSDAIKDTQDTQGNQKDPPLPLVDSHAQHLIQKRIAVEKLSRSLRDVVGPLRLTMSDVINEINNLVKTFRFTNTNIIHKRPEWTLIAVVLLSVLTEVSPLLRESLASPSSVEYISSLMSELKLEDEDLHNLVLLFKPCVTPQT